MKKKILIVIVAVAMMIPLLAVGVCADYSPETGWSEPIIVPDVPVWVNDGSGNGIDGNYESYIYSEYRVLSFPDYLVEGVAVPYLDLDDGNYYFLTASMYSFTNSDYTVYFPNEQYLGFFSTVVADGFQVGIKVTTVGGVKNAMLIINLDGMVNDFVPLVSNMQNTFGDGYRFLAGYVGDYPPVAENLEFFSMIPFEYVTASTVPATHPFLALIELMFDNFSRIIGGLAAGITGAFTALIWENPEATEKSLSTLAKFIFTIAGLSIGMTVFYLVLRLIRFGRQR